MMDSKRATNMNSNSQSEPRLTSKDDNKGEDKRSVLHHILGSGSQLRFRRVSSKDQWRIYRLVIAMASIDSFFRHARMEVDGEMWNAMTELQDAARRNMNLGMAFWFRSLSKREAFVLKAFLHRLKRGIPTTFPDGNLRDGMCKEICDDLGGCIAPRMYGLLNRKVVPPVNEILALAEKLILNELNANGISPVLPIEVQSRISRSYAKRRLMLRARRRMRRAGRVFKG